MAVGAVALVLILIAVGQWSNGTQPRIPAIVSIDIEPSQMNMKVGEKKPFKAKLKDASGRVFDGKPEQVTWTSDNRIVATVNAEGMVTGLSPGSATIVAVSQGKKAVAAVKVDPAQPQRSPQRPPQ